MTVRRLTELAAALHEGRCTARQLAARATGPDPFGATEQVLYTEAAAGADAADLRRATGRALSRLDGIPFAVKANIDVAGVPTTSGTALPALPAAADAAVVRILRAAGLVPVRTATMAELALGSVTDNPHTGACRNPLDPSRAAGGSSGGSAALVAAGLVPLALGSDTLGSVRIPAAYCEVAAWKPTRDLVPVDGLVALHPYLDTVGFIAPTARDLVSVAECVLGAERPPAKGPVRVAVPSFASRTDRAGRHALEAARAALVASGAVVTDTTNDLDLPLVRRRGLLMAEADTSRRFAAALECGAAGLSDRVRGLLRYGRDAGIDRVAAAMADLTETAAAVASAMTEVEVLLVPTTPAGPPPVGIEPADAADLTAWVNVAGLPAVATPVGGHTGDGSRRSVQLVGRAGSDLALIGLAASLESSPW